MMNSTDNRPDLTSGKREIGSALVLALLIMVIMTLLGLAFMLVGETEAKIARNSRDGAQAAFAAEGGARIVMKWFNAPSGSSSYLVPTTSQMDRTQRWVDPERDGTYVAYSSALAPWDVYYKQGTDDPFDLPYKGAAKDFLAGSEEHPDIKISETGSSNEQAFLTSLNSSLFSSFPSTNQNVRIIEIEVYGPPMLLIGGSMKRGGIGTIKVTAGVYEFVGTAATHRIATRVVKAVLAEMRYAAGGAIESCSNFDASGAFAAHWGNVTSVQLMDLNANIDNKVNSGVPYYLNQHRFIARDMDLNGTVQLGSGGVGTPDDLDGDGTADFDDWVASPDVEDPWLKFMSESEVKSSGKALSPGCSAPNCQPIPFWQSPSTFGTGDIDHSNLFKNVQHGLCPDYPYDLWKAIAQFGAPGTYYYSSDGAGTGTYKRDGSGSSMDFRTATEGKSGLFFFDSANNAKPVDGNSDGTYDNLADEVFLNGGGWTAGGFIYLNADFKTTGSGNVSVQRQLIAPGEPYIDANGNGLYDSDEYFIDLTYPAARDGTYVKHGMRRVDDGYTRQDPSVDAGTAGKYDADINMYGILYTNGQLNADGDWIYFGSAITGSGMPTPGLTGTPDFWFDERMAKGTWPPGSLGLPRVYPTAWQTE